MMQNKCQTCLKSFENETDLERHIAKHQARIADAIKSVNACQVRGIRLCGFSMLRNT
ncbi:hypothetical protein B0H67DRAFT_594962 [Lasiosphaeris hirsuta]|uniref:C2H2-type domain-containing protein n=1 Tax=Lasiosphaeris hirsuta TaxID=260670 RepID=A0AA39ZS65_9PEZI|nr:hypothetical protein B0H67DRAFT_594962 [Lasiosphaeris hirsuta]